MIGQLEAIWRFPVKSMRGERLDEAELHKTGLRGDRQYAFVRSNDRSRFPWLTGRQIPDLVRWIARYDRPNPATAKLTVEDPLGQIYAIDDPALQARLADEAGEPVALIQLGRGAQDSMGISLVGSDIGDRVGAAHGAPIDRRRFRINFEVRLAPDAPNETGWPGAMLTVGDAVRLVVVEPIERCVMISIDPDTGIKDPSVVRTVAQKFGNEIGVYASVFTTGTVRAGDAVVRTL